MTLHLFEIISTPDSLQISTDDTEENPIIQNVMHLHNLICLHVQCTLTYSYFNHSSHRNDWTIILKMTSMLGWLTQQMSC
jgi:hypothetical protein